VNYCNTPVTYDPVDGDCARPLDQYYPGGNPFGSVDIKRDIGASTYHGLNLSLEHRMKAGLAFQTRYTWSHSINNGSVGGGESSGPENVNCLPCDKGPSIFDIRNNFTANVVYELPMGTGKRFLNEGGRLDKIVGGWQLSSVGLFHTGHPLTVQMDLSNNIQDPNNPLFPYGLASTYLLPDGNDQTSQRPDVIPGVPLTLPGGGHNGMPLINAAAFTAPPVNAQGFFTRYGNAPNGLIRALAAWQIDLELTKITKLTERVSMEFGVQAFNIFNHVQLGDPGNFTLVYDTTVPGTNLSVPGSFGLITTTNNFNNNNDNQASPNTGTGLPRQLQFMLRFIF
jgi:hypothetical protein